MLPPGQSTSVISFVSSIVGGVNNLTDLPSVLLALSCMEGIKVLHEKATITPHLSEIFKQW